VPLIIAIEPDSRQASIVKRIVRERVGAEVVLADSKDAALAALRQRMPDLILVSALLSPRDESHLTDRLRELADAEHLQTLTIPLLASGPQAAPAKKGKGLLAKLSRKRPVVGTEGCEPAVFAEEIRGYLDRAHEVRRESAARRERERLEAIEAEHLEAIERERQEAIAAEVNASIEVAAEPAFEALATLDVEQDSAVETETASEVEARVFETTEAASDIESNLTELERGLSMAYEKPQDEAAPEPTPTEVEWSEDAVELSEDLNRLSEDESLLVPVPEALARLEATSHDAERLEATQQEERLEATRREAARLEAELREATQREAERLQAEQLEAMRREAARLEAERREAAQREADRLQAEQLEAMRRDAERLEAERLEAIRRDAERREVERLEAMRLEAERLEAQRLEAMRLEAERLEAERVEALRREAERLETQRLETLRREAERLEAQRLEALRREAERLEAQRLEAMRQEAERLETERVEALRREAERLEAQRLEAARRETERREAERREAAQRDAERREAEQFEAARREAERLSKQPEEVSDMPAPEQRLPDSLMHDKNWITSAIDALRMEVQLLRTGRAVSASSAPDTPVEASPVEEQQKISPASPKKPGKKKAQASQAKPLQDEWGIYDPGQCGFDALFAKINEASHEDETEDDEPYTIPDSDRIDASDMLVAHSSPSSFTASLAETPMSPKRAGLAPLAMWAHAETTDPPRAKTSAADHLQRLMGQLQLPAGVASVSYPSGCRIRQIRVTQTEPSARKAKSDEPIVILSRKRLRELRRKEKPSAVSRQPSAISHRPLATSR